MFSTIRWCQYTSAAALLLGLACSSSSSEPSKTADSVAPDPAPSPSVEAQTQSSASDSEGTGAYQADPNGAHLNAAERGPAQGPSAMSTGPGAYADDDPRIRAEAKKGPAAKSEGTRASRDEAAERVPVAGRDEPVQLDDARIVAITHAANTGEVEQGRLARQRAKDPRVRDFAAMMVDHHGKALSKQEKLKIEPQPGADVLNMQREGKQRMADLREKKGSEFDRAYIQLQIEEHRRLLDKLNRELMPAAKEKALVSYLEEIRPQVESHLAQAERLQQELSTAKDEGSKNETERSRTVIKNEPGSPVRATDPR